MRVCYEAAGCKQGTERKHGPARDQVPKGSSRAPDGACQEEVARHRGLEALCGAGPQQGWVFLDRLRYSLRHYAPARRVVNM